MYYIEFLISANKFFYYVSAYHIFWVYIFNILENYSINIFPLPLPFIAVHYVHVLRNRRKRSIRSSTLNLLAVEYGRYRKKYSTDWATVYEMWKAKWCGMWGTLFLKYTHFSDRRNALLMLAKNIYPSFESCTDAEKTYFLLSNADVVIATASYVIDCLY